MNKTFGQQVLYLFKKAWAFILVIFMTNGVSGQTQSVLLVADTFNAANTSDVVFDYAGPSGNFGINDWTVNVSYSGDSVYPNTPNEDSVLAGLGNITFAPFSSYLHIHDVTEPNGAADANWNHNSPSDRFCVPNYSLCTMGLTDVSFAFFWTGDGDSTAYGRVYYSSNGGATWAQTGRPKYNYQPEWEYEVIHDTNFNNQQSLIFGFRWTNKGSDTTRDVSFGIDDIIAVGNYTRTDSAGNSKFHIISVMPDTNCENGTLTVSYSLIPPLCYGNYTGYLSSANGSFANPVILQSVTPISFDGQGYGQAQFLLPNDDTGSCFKVRIARTDPDPIFISDTSLCFTIRKCPVSIITSNAPVVTDVDTACLKSAIDIYFNSFGNFNDNNIYYAQLSDSTGSFANPVTIGRLPSNQAYPAMPGDVSGLIPASVPPGCGYYIRIVSSGPASIGTAIGPYCLKDCDVTTNNTQDLHVCVNYPSLIDTLTFKISDDQWPPGANYDTCNNWTVQLLDMMTFNVVNTGGLGIYHVDTPGVFKLIVGPLSQLENEGIQPGTYYMRILSTGNCTNEPWDTTGTVIRITIGAPAITPAVGIYSPTGDSVFCNTQAAEFCPFPVNPGSTYTWNSNFFPNLVTDTPRICINILLNPATPIGSYVVYVTETNYGCKGPTSAPFNLIITADPKVHITGPKSVCLGDSAVFNATFYPATYYTWSAPPGVKLVLQSNTQVEFVFDSIGKFIITGHALNDCGNETGYDTINVFQLFNVNAKPDKTVCLGDSVTLEGVIAPFPKTFLSLDSVTQPTFPTPGGMFNIHTHNDIIIDSFAVLFKSLGGSCGLSMYIRSGGYHGYEQNQAGWNAELLNFNVPLSNHVATQSVIPIELNKHIAAGDTVAFYITSTDSAINLAYANGTGIQQGIVYKSDGVIDFIQGTQNKYLFGASNGPRVLDVTIYYRTLGGLHYLWSNGATTDTISFLPTQSQQYNIKVYDTTGCRDADTVMVTVDTFPHVYAGPDTLICPNSNYIMMATASSSATLNWSPAIGLSQASALNPTLNITQTTDLILTATGQGGCAKSDSVLISIYPLTVNAGPDTTLCADETYVMQGLASTDSFEWFPATGLSAVNILNPVFSYAQSNQYDLTVQDAEGCKLTDTVLITVEYCDVYIKVPSAFTPNGDGVNDFFTVFGKYISDYHIKIYNRWGEEVYSSSNVNELNDLSRGWDGTYKGKLQDIGTFVYYIEAKDLNGHNVFRKGNVTLIR